MRLINLRQAHIYPEGFFGCFCTNRGGSGAFARHTAAAVRLILGLAVVLRTDGHGVAAPGKPGEKKPATKGGFDRAAAGVTR